MNTDIAPKKNKIRQYVAGGTVLLIVLAGAAFLAGRLMNNGPAGLNLFNPGGPMGGRAMSIEIKMTTAPELPVTQPEAHGLYTSREGNSIFISPLKDGGSGVMVQSGPSAGGEKGGFSYNPAEDEDAGPVIEVVITHETKVYRDATEFPSFDDPVQVIQQVVETGSLEDLNDQTMVSVWGRKTGNRIIAEMIFYTKPVVFRKEAN